MNNYYELFFIPIINEQDNSWDPNLLRISCNVSISACEKSDRWRHAACLFAQAGLRGTGVGGCHGSFLLKAVCCLDSHLSGVYIVIWMNLSTYYVGIILISTCIYILHIYIYIRVLHMAHTCDIIIHAEYLSNFLMSVSYWAATGAVWWKSSWLRRWEYSDYIGTQRCNQQKDCTGLNCCSSGKSISLSQEVCSVVSSPTMPASAPAPMARCGARRHGCGVTNAGQQQGTQLYSKPFGAKEDDSPC